MIDEDALAESNALNNRYNFEALLSDLRRYRYHGRIDFAIERLDYFFAQPDTP